MSDKNAVTFSVAQSDATISRVIEEVKKNGEAIITENDQPKYLVLDINNNDYLLDLTDDERFDIIAKRILKRYLPAFKELAK